MRKKWTPEKIDSVLGQLIQEFGYLPPTGVFRSRGLMGLMDVIRKQRGGIRAERIRLGVEGLKKCVRCDSVFNRTMFRIRRKNRSGFVENWVSNVCLDCERKEVIDYRNTWRGLAADMVRRAKHRAKKAGLGFSINKKISIFSLGREWFLLRCYRRTFCSQA